MPAELELLYCPTCAGEQLAEAPPCPDGHADSCPDRACTQCGTALLLDVPLFALVRGAAGARQRRTPRRTGSRRSGSRSAA